MHKVYNILFKANIVIVIYLFIHYISLVVNISGITPIVLLFVPSVRLLVILFDIWCIYFSAVCSCIEHICNKKHWCLNDVNLLLSLARLTAHYMWCYIVLIS